MTSGNPVLRGDQRRHAEELHHRRARLVGELMRAQPVPRAAPGSVQDDGVTAGQRQTRAPQHRVVDDTHVLRGVKAGIQHTLTAGYHSEPMQLLAHLIR
ncbi:Uncharacterised protein [Mycobacteroides abscessus subsp. abscessus]|nr:Uncharacterised protein [Mycobacteroides abscessus subsp. abscessus]